MLSVRAVAASAAVTSAGMLLSAGGCAHSPKTPPLTDTAFTSPPPWLAPQKTYLPSTNGSLLETMLQDQKSLEEMAPSVQILPQEVSSILLPETRVMRAVAFFSCSMDGDPELIAQLRCDLATAMNESGDPYLHSICRLYLILPTPHLVENIYTAPDAAVLLRAKQDPRQYEPMAGYSYPQHAIELFAQLQTIFSRIPDRKALAQYQRAANSISWSPLMKATFEKEGPGTDPEVVERAKLEMVKILIGIKDDLNSALRFRLTNGPLPAEEVAEIIVDYLDKDFRWGKFSQNYLCDGLASHILDCDMCAKIAYEAGYQLNIPIRLVFLFDNEQKFSFGHCAPAIEGQKRVRAADGSMTRETIYVIFETQDPIEVLPDGKKRIIYKTLGEMRDRINKQLGYVAFGEEDHPWIGTPEFLLSQIRSRPEAVGSSANTVKP